MSLFVGFVGVGISNMCIDCCACVVLCCVVLCCVVFLVHSSHFKLSNINITASKQQEH